VTHSSTPEAPPTQEVVRGRVRPERRRRGDVIAVAVIAVVVLVGAVVLWRTSPVVATTDSTAATPIAAPPRAGDVPAGFAEAWRAASGATPAPVVSGPAVVTADGSTVIGRDAVSGAERWRYSRDIPLCTVGSGFPSADNGAGRLLALYQGPTGWCSELTALRPDTGARAASSNPDVHPGTRLIADGTFVAATGSDYLEVWRSDLVRTLEYGAVPTPVQVGVQPRTGCTYGSTALMQSRLGLIERCPGETTDRLTVVTPDGSGGAEKPQVEFSVPLPPSALPSAGATVVALSADRVAVALPAPTRLMILDRTGRQIGLISLDVPDADLARSVAVAPTSTDGNRVYWWTGSATVALDAADLAPVWTAPGTLGPAVAYGTGLLAPVPGGLVELDPRRGTVLRTIPLPGAGGTAPVRLAVQGDILLAQRGSEVVAYRPS
jgi:hypothetical protein